MTLLHRLKIRTKLGLFVALLVAAIVSVGAIGATTLHRQMLDDRIDKYRSHVHSTVALAAALEARVAASELTREQALERLRGDIHALRFDGGTGYVIAIDLKTGFILAHGANSAQEGKPGPTVPPTGRSVFEVLTETLRSSDEGIMWYSFPKPGQTEPLRKVFATERYAPWNMAVFSGAYTDDLDAQFGSLLVTMTAVGGGIVALTLILVWLIGRDITGSLGVLRTQMGLLAGGDLGADVSGKHRRDEIGDMAGAVQVFKDAMIRAEQLAAEREQTKVQAAAIQKAAMAETADAFQGKMGALVDMLSAGAAELETTARSMSETATRTNGQAVAVASAAEEASTGVGTVAAAAEELTASIQEISRQVAQSAKIAEQAVVDAQRTDRIVQALASGAEKIGHVVGLITTIAGQTNLLALNATIEAARAGDAGKGFAVVASEVKSLANQTAKATDEIGAQIAAIQLSTTQAVDAIRAITGTIEEVSAISVSIAAAVEEQGAATAEIARNVQQTAHSANDVTVNIGGVSRAATETGTAATLVLSSAGNLSRQAEQLNDEIGGFVAAVRAA